MNNFELFSRPCMVAGLNLSPESNQQMISAAFSYDSSAKKYFNVHRKVEPGANAIKELFKEGIECFSKRSGSGGKPARIIIFCSFTGEENFYDVKYLKSAISSITERYSPKLTIIAVQEPSAAISQSQNQDLEFYIRPEQINARPFSCSILLDENNFGEESIQMLSFILSVQNHGSLLPCVLAAIESENHHYF